MKLAGARELELRYCISSAIFGLNEGHDSFRAMVVKENMIRHVLWHCPCSWLTLDKWIDGMVGSFGSSIE
ncbi:MAG: hypothetical protein QXP01_01265 [Candidatus Hadarchaeum sp.]